VAIAFQYNKTYLQLLNKQLKVRETALPTLQAKESALRLEVKKAKDEVQKIEEEIQKKKIELDLVSRLWGEFPGGLVKVANVLVDYKKIAGVHTPIFKKVVFTVKRFSLVNYPSWIPAGIELMMEFKELRIKKEIALKKVAILEYARKKTTQKVNLYEKVQIPGYKEVILKIKRFLEDDENLAKSSQKILKARMALAEATA